MKDCKGVSRSKCKKCDCDEFMREKNLNLRAYCDHSPCAHEILHELEEFTGEHSEATSTITSGNADEESRPLLNDSSRSCNFNHSTVLTSVLQQVPATSCMETGDSQSSETPTTASASTKRRRLLTDGCCSRTWELCPSVSQQPSEATLANLSDASLSSHVTPLHCPSKSPSTVHRKNPSSETPATTAAASLSTPHGSPPSIMQLNNGVGDSSVPKTELFKEGLNAVLQSCTDGMIVLAAGKLNQSLRGKLAAVVVNHITQQRDVSNRPTNSDMKQAAEAIVACFAEEHMILHKEYNVAALPA